MRWRDPVVQVSAAEVAKLAITPERLSIDPQAIVIEIGNREWEAKALEVIGSTKKGVGAAIARKIVGRGAGGESFGHKVRFARVNPELLKFARPAFVELERAFDA